MRMMQTRPEKGCYLAAAPTEKRNSASPSKSYKTSLCDTYMANGHCGRGENCNFAHGKNDIRTRFRPPNYKTKLCKNMYKFGACPYEEKCDFIHNSSEATKVPDHTLPAEDCNTATGFTGNRASAGICNISSSSSRQRRIRVENTVCPVELERFAGPLVDICRQHSLPLASVSMEHYSQLSLLPTTIDKTPPAPIGMERAQMAGIPQPLPLASETIGLSLSPQRNNFFLGSYVHGSPAAIPRPQLQSAAGKNFNHPQFESVKTNRVSHRVAGLPGQKAVPPIFGRDNGMGPADFGKDMVLQLLGEGERCRRLPENLGNLNINYKQFY